MHDTPRDNQVIPKRPARWRRLRGCGITLAIILIVGLVSWWVVSRNLGGVLAGLVREQAAAAINGRLEFDRLEVDLAGRAVLTNAAVYAASGADPLVTCPRTVIAFDLLNFIGPNRGRRAVTVTLHQPHLTLVRELDGSFNLAHLVKTDQPETEPVGLALHLREATVDFTDWCLLDQSYPRLTPTGGMAGDLLSDLGYDLLGPPEMRPHREQLEITGNVVVNPQRNELTLNLTFRREAPGGVVTAKGSAALDGTRFDLRTGLRDIDFSSFTAYLRAIFPRLAIATATTAASDAAGSAPKPPFLAGRLARGSLRLSKHPATPVALTAELELADTSLQAGDLPAVLCRKLTIDYNSDTGRLLAGVDVTGAGLRLTGKPQLNLKQETLGGKLKLDCVDPAALAAYLGRPGLELSGSLSAQLLLAGGLADPLVTAKLSSDKLKYRQLSLGQLSGAVEYGGHSIVISDVEFTKGEIPLAVSGSVNTGTQDGAVELAIGPLTIATTLDLAAKLAPALELPELETTGAFSATAAVTLTAGNPNATLHLWSAGLTINGQRLEGLDIRSTLTGPNLNIDTAEALLVTPAVDLGGFASNGPLRIKLRAGGSLSTLPEQSAATVAFIGEGVTQNLAPTQARASFKIIGPTTDPEIRLQLKTIQADQPLVISANGHYRAGFAPVTASLTWQESTADFAGQIDFAGQRVKGTLTADSVNLRRFSGDKDVSGTLSATAELGGTFTKPSVNGSIAVPLLSYVLPTRTVTFVDAAAKFKLIAGTRFSVTDGRFGFDGNHFTVAGELGDAQSTLAVRCHEFNLFSALAMTHQPPPAPGAKQAYLGPALDIHSAGPLLINLTGKLTDPAGTIEYTSGAGTVKGHAFTSAELRGSFSKSAARLEHFEIRSPEGRIAADGRCEFSPLRYSGSTTVEDFDVAVLSALTDDPAAAGLTGKLNGKLRVAGTGESYSLDGNLRLANGSFQGIAVSIASAEFQTAGSSITIRNGNVVAEGTMLTAYGSFDPTSASPLASTTLNVDATSLDLALLRPLLGDMVTDLSGRLAGKLSLVPGSGRYPSATLSAHSINRIRIDSAGFDSIRIAAAVAQDKLSLTKCELVSGASTLSASGQLDLGTLQRGRAVPLDLTLNTNALNLDDFKTLLPDAEQAQLPSGVVTCRNIRVTGTSAKPLVSGTVDFDLTGLPAQFDLLARATGSVVFSGSELQLNNVRLTPAGAANTAKVITVSAEVHHEAALITVKNGKIVADGTTLTATGSFNPTAEDPLAGANLTIDAAALDLALLQPFLGGKIQTLSGHLVCKLSLTPGPGRFPNASLSAYSTAPITIDDSEFDSLRIAASSIKDKLNVTQCELVSGQSTLSASGQLDLGSLRDGRTVPLDLTLNTNALNLGDLKHLLPVAQQSLLPGGVLTCRNIRLTGNTKSPLISGDIVFDLSDMPAQYDMLARATGSISCTSNDFEINDVLLTPASASSGVSGSAVVSGSGRFSLLPFRLVEGAVSIDLAPDGNYLLVDTTESRSEMLSTLNFTGRVGGNLLLTGGQDRHGDQRMQISGTIVINKPGEVSRITVYQKETGELGSTPAPFIFSPQLTVKMEAGTSLYYKPMDLSGKFVGDLRTELFTQNVALTGVPGISNPADPEAFRINGTILMPTGSVKVYRHIVRLEGEGTQLRFLGIPGEIMPVFDGTGTLVLRNVLSTAATTAANSTDLGGRSSASGNRDLKIIFSFTQFQLEMEGAPVSTNTAPGGLNGATPGLRITSEPPLPENQIVAYLLGGAQDVISGQTGLGDFAQGEIVAYGSSFISREIEEMFNLSSFQFGGIGDDRNPFYVDIEKQVTPDFSVTYYRDYFSSSTQNEEFGIKYRLMEQHQGQRYQNLELEVNFQDNAFSGSGSEFMFTWTTSF